MITRVLTPPPSMLASYAPQMAGLPPGTATEIPLNVVYVSGQNAGSAASSSLVTADGAPVYATGPGRWGQLAAAGSRP